jgi:hypothetical protein
MEISRLGPGDEDRVAAAADLFDDPPRPMRPRSSLPPKDITY